MTHVSGDVKSAMESPVYSVGGKVGPIIKDDEMMTSAPRSMSVVLAMLGILCSTARAYPTWSIMACDKTTGQIGVAGASCTEFVKGIEQIVPGKGAVVVQAMSNPKAREQAVKLLRLGATSAQILSAMRDKGFDPEDQQYGVLIPGQSPETYSGKRITGWYGALKTSDVLVMGNCLVDSRVVVGALNAFQAAAGKSLAERLMAALAAGANAGGDKRCGEQRATSAFVSVFKPDDNAQTPYLNLVVYGLGKGDQKAVAILEKEFDSWSRLGKDRRSTQLFILPGATE